MKHRIFYIFLIFITAGFFCSTNFLKELREEVQREMRMHIFLKKIKDKDLILFTSKQLEDARWLSKKEFKLNGELYDIVKIVDQKLYCIKDHKETKIREFEEKSLPLFGFTFKSQKCFSSKAKPVKNQKQVFYLKILQDVSLFSYNSLLKKYTYILKGCIFTHSKIFPPPKFYTVI